MITGLNLTPPTWADLARATAALPLALGNALWRWYRRHRDLRHLSQLDDYLLRDIGLSRSKIDAEALKPFWRR